MHINTETQTLYSASDNLRLATNKNRLGEIVETGNSTVEKNEESTQWSSVFSSRKHLSPEELRRVEFLKNLLLQTLTMAQGDPTEDQKKQIREIEDELEELTGVKTHTRISNATDKLPGKDKDDEEEDKYEQQAQGIDPKEAIHNNIDVGQQKLSPGMQMLRNNAIMTNIATMATPFDGDLTLAD